MHGDPARDQPRLRHYAGLTGDQRFFLAFAQLWSRAVGSVVARPSQH
jgi:hypothetical protein